MARDYERVLAAAEELMNFGGYLDSEDRKQQSEAQGRFDGEVRIFVYELYRETPDHGALAFSVAGDLDRISATGTHSEAAVADTRAALLAEIQKRSRDNSAMRFLIRWGPPVVGVLAAAAFLFFKVYMSQ